MKNKKEILKVNKEEIVREKAVISYAEIIIMIISIFAFSYIIYQPMKDYDKLKAEKAKELGVNLEEIENQEKEKTGILTLLLIEALNQFKKPMIPRVSAAEDIVLYTCKESKTGEFCQEFLSSECDSKCKDSCFPGKRENFAECKLGCCVDSLGKCMASSPKSTCENAEGTWVDNKDCSSGNIPECKVGCCVLGNNVRALVTEKECTFYSLNSGLQLDWRQEMNEPECLVLALTQEKGACVIGESCKFVTASECISLEGDFAQDYLCTHPDLQTNCKPTEKTICLEGESVGKDGVYFVDSCGNVANIYDSSKYDDEDYWKRVYSLDESCNPSSSNANSKTCGNCNYMLGSRCGSGSAEHGNYICKDMNCKDAIDNNNEKKDRINGESWCVFDGAIGGGKDLVGSRHFRYNCINGEVKAEPCADFRNEICVQSDIEEAGGFSNAACRINSWQECIFGKGCSNSPDCMSRHLQLSDDMPAFDVCVPKYPEGFDIRTEAGQKAAKDICKMASFKCTVIYVHELTGWKCVQNCECMEDSNFAKQMSDWCYALGDCGFKKNIAGVCTKNYKFSSGTAPNGDKADDIGVACAGSLNFNNKYPEPGNAAEQLTGTSGGGGRTGDIGGELESYEPEDISGKFMLGLSGATGIAYGIASIQSGTFLVSKGAALELFNSAGAAPFFNVLAAAAAGAIIGYMVGSLFGLQGQGLAATAIAGGIAGGVSGGILAAGVPAGGSIAAGTSLAAGSSVALGTLSSGGASIAGTTYAIGTPLVAGGEAVSSIAIVTETSGLTTMTALSSTGAELGVASSLTETAIITETSTLSGPGVAGGSGAGMAFAAAVLIVIVIIIIVVIIVALIMKALGIGDMKEVIVEFRCKPWQAPKGGNDCEKCSENGKPCSKYRCQSLGQACKFVNEGTGNELCIASENNGKSPIISPNKDALLDGYKYENIEGGIKVVQENGECIQAFTPIQFGITTDKAAQCKYDIVHAPTFDEMSEWFGDSNLYEFNHSMQISLPSIESITEQYNVTTEQVREMYGNLKLYTRCQDDWGNFNVNEYLINICVKPGADTTPPLIMKTIPENNAYVQFGVSEQAIVAFTNEPAQCKYDSGDKDYNLMTKTMSCQTSLASQTLYGWQCSTTLGNLTAGENKIFIRCKDKPWLPEENNTRQVNKQGFEYVLKKSENKLKIESIAPSGIIKGGGEPVSVDLDLTTSGGAENGKAFCSYQWAGNWILFFETFSSSHKQSGLNLYRGTYNIPVKCEDVAGDVVEDNLKFEIKIDNTPPKITRVYNSGGLKVFTDEDAECVYDFKTCNYIWSNATEMSGLEKEHSASFEQGNTYYIKCKDLWENKPQSCSIIVRAE